jgi:hypothetical protein
MGEQFSLGIDIKGSYLKQPSSLEEVGRLVEGWTLGKDETNARRKRDKLEGASQRPLLPSHKVNVNDLSQTGWAVIFAEGIDPAVREALAPLLDQRKKEATGLLPTGYRELSGELAYRTDDSREDFLNRWKLGAGAVVAPGKLPYYLLLVGSPREIPFEIQYELAIDYAVGRLWFDTPEEYARYAHTVMEIEARPSGPHRHAALFGTAHEGDPATQASARTFVKPLGETLRQEYPDWNIEMILGAQATKPSLTSLLAQRPPSLLFTASHATLLGKGDPRQRELQGALVCEGWQPGTGVGSKDLFAAADLPSGADLQGLMAFLFACSSAGTPDQDDFYSFTEDDFLGADEPFLSRLPQRLLTQGAAAVIGHVDRVWMASFLYDQDREETGDIEVFKETARFLLDGYRAGHAIGPMTRRHASLSAGVLDQQLRLLRQQPVDRKWLGDLWLRSNDARNYLLLGDPAARLSVTSVVEKG